MTDIYSHKSDHYFNPEHHALVDRQSKSQKYNENTEITSDLLQLFTELSLEQDKVDWEESNKLVEPKKTTNEIISIKQTFDEESTILASVITTSIPEQTIPGQKISGQLIPEQTISGQTQSAIQTTAQTSAQTTSMAQIIAQTPAQTTAQTAQTPAQTTAQTPAQTTALTMAQTILKQTITSLVEPKIITPIRIDTKEDIICPVCSKDSLIINNGVKLCSSCGTELGNEISSEAEWRYYSDSNKTDPNRCGVANNPLLYESSFSTSIATNTYSSYFYKTINKLQTWQMMSPQERSLKTVFDRIFHQANVKGIPSSIIQYAQSLFKTVIKEQGKTAHRLSRGSNRDGLIAACLFYSCSLHKVNRSKKEIAQIFEMDESDVTKGCKLFFKLMNKIMCLTANVMTHTDFIDRFCSNLGLSDNIKKMVHQIADKAWTLGIVQNNTPPTIAAGAIFFVSTIYNLNLSKKIISQQCQTSHVTITKTYNILINHLEDLL